MFKFKINHKGDTIQYQNLNISSMSYTDLGRTLILVTCKNHKLHSGDIIVFQENDGDQRVFREEREITVNDKDSFYIDGFPDYGVSVTEVDSAITTYYVKEDSTYKNLRYLNFTVDTHDIISYRGDVSVRENVSKEYYKNTDENYERMCINDYILCGNFLYHSTGFTSNRKYTFSEDFLNIKDKYIYYINSDGENVILGGGNVGDYVKFSDSQNIVNVNKGLTKGLLIVPSSYDGKDDRNSLYWCFNVYNETDIMKYIYDNYANIVFYCKDERFFTEVYEWQEYDGDKSASIEGKPEASWKYDGLICEDEEGNKYICSTTLNLKLNVRYDGEVVIHTTTVSAEISNYNITIPLASDFGTNIIQQELLGDKYLENEEEKAINSIIDYEKIQFSPSYIYYHYDSETKKSEGFDLSHDTGETVDDILYEGDFDSYLKKVNNIVFNLHFRKREKDDSGDYGEFNTDDELFWNSYDNPDLIGNLGFTDNDVYYQKKKLKKSFLRLSYYDSRNRGSQTLLGYNTIFVDTGKLYNKYIKIISNYSSDEIDIYGGAVYMPCVGYEDMRLSMSLECTSKYDRDISSDGFYLYLFKNVISGTTLTPIYIKADFNHAKYGKTLSMSYPVDDDYKPYNRPPVNYRKGEEDDNGNEILEIDTAKAIKDTYIKVYVKYNPLTNDYVWFLPKSSDTDTITFDLWEPRINGLYAGEEIG